MLNTTDMPSWEHTRRREKPAELLSRGVQSKVIARSNLCWNVPSCCCDYNFSVQNRLK